MKTFLFFLMLVGPIFFMVLVSSVSGEHPFVLHEAMAVWLAVFVFIGLFRNKL